MAKVSKRRPSTIPRIQLSIHQVMFKPVEPSLLVQRMHELDREFARQTKHLAKVTRQIRRKFIERM